MDLVALDIGNGSIKWGRFEAGARVDGGRLVLDAEPPGWTADVPLAAVSVNPAVDERWKAARPRLARLGRELPLPLPVRYRPPADCGVDRVAGLAHDGLAAQIVELQHDLRVLVIRCLLRHGRSVRVHGRRRKRRLVRCTVT